MTRNDTLGLCDVQSLHHGRPKSVGIPISAREPNFALRMGSGISARKSFVLPTKDLGSKLVERFHSIEFIAPNLYCCELVHLSIVPAFSWPGLTNNRSCSPSKSKIKFFAHSWVRTAGPDIKCVFLLHTV